MVCSVVLNCEQNAESAIGLFDVQRHADTRTAGLKQDFPVEVRSLRAPDELAGFLKRPGLGSPCSFDNRFGPCWMIRGWFGHARSDGSLDLVFGSGPGGHYNQTGQVGTGKRHNNPANPLLKSMRTGACRGGHQNLLSPATRQDFFLNRPARHY